jgi:hypothetical protein
MSDVRLPEPLGLEPSFGFGDRLGLATPGHVAALRACGAAIRPIFAQQSIREMTRTGRTPSDVMRDAVQALEAADFSDAWGADADHLKTTQDAEATAQAGFVFFTIDPSDRVDARAGDYDEATLAAKFAEVREAAAWVPSYVGRRIKISDSLTIEFDELTVRRAAVKYGRALAHAIAMSQHIDRVMAERDAAYEIELSVDETPQPTTPAEHYIVAEQCLQSDMNLVSLAPRYVGDFEKGIDYKGDRAAFEASLDQHAAIAHALGPYKLSLHSGSDKLSIYEAFARITGGMFHVKTAGTSYLEALRVAARCEPGLFREIVEFSRARFESDKATYHISARLDAVPAADRVDGAGKLEQVYLNENDGRQILHVTFGSVLTDASLGQSLREVLAAHADTHQEVLKTHFAKHLEPLARGL